MYPTSKRRDSGLVRECCFAQGNKRPFKQTVTYFGVTLSCKTVQ